MRTLARMILTPGIQKIRKRMKSQRGTERQTGRMRQIPLKEQMTRKSAQRIQKMRVIPGRMTQMTR